MNLLYPLTLFFPLSVFLSLLSAGFFSLGCSASDLLHGSVIHSLPHYTKEVRENGLVDSATELSGADEESSVNLEWQMERVKKHAAVIDWLTATPQRNGLEEGGETSSKGWDTRSESGSLSISLGSVITRAENSELGWSRFSSKEKEEQLNGAVLLLEFAAGSARDFLEKFYVGKGCKG